MIAPAYALKYPAHVKALGLLSTVAGRSTEDKNNILSVIKLMEEKGVAKIIPTLVNRWFTDDFIKKSPAIIKRSLQQVIDMDPNTFLNVFRIYANTEMKTWLHKIAVPTLVLTGENDKGCNPKLNQFMASQLVNSKLIILPNFKHSILIEAPNLVSKNLNNFFTKDH